MRKQKKTNSVKSKVNELYEMMKEQKLEELEVKEEGFYLHIKRKSIAPKRVAVKYELPDEDVYSQAQVEPVSAGKQVPSVPGDTIKSPIIGVFYRSPSPSSPAFAKEGDVINSGQTLCIVEAMKVMNEIKAEYKMKIVKMLVENGTPVTMDEDLFVIEKV